MVFTNKRKINNGNSTKGGGFIKNIFLMAKREFIYSFGWLKPWRIEWKKWIKESFYKSERNKYRVEGIDNSKEISAGGIRFRVEIWICNELNRNKDRNEIKKW